ncbi:hypothetical protein [Kribbella pratensis]|uniref:Helix-turn-helix protein n=1 Tax=Kribbella pratensis TaxID=2512112 RepID=A0A4R8CH02_9ACTN|nr:hypothetical protein [Kribbella pratensis]TDW74965.1 hypothetical protein EV653_0075 [Kribbella pratensis]
MSELAADGIPVAVTCRVLKIARQPYYRWLARPVTTAELEQAYRANALFDAHRDDPEFGYRFLVDEARDAGEPMADRTAWRICSAMGWWSAFGKARGKNGKKPAPTPLDRTATTTYIKSACGVPAGSASRVLTCAALAGVWHREGTAGSAPGGERGSAVLPNWLFLEESIPPPGVPGRSTRSGS